MITHNPEAASIASRILYMRDGEIVREEKGSRPVLLCQLQVRRYLQSARLPLRFDLI